jgi:deoxyribodipyrimidine photo-lyase
MLFNTKSAARNALSQFLPKSGQDYTTERNYDNGPNKEASVSKLSPWVRIRALPEWVIISEVLQQHNVTSAAKFIDEVCWRTYWKGWLQMRPSIWQDYLNERATLHKEYSINIAYHRAIEGRTGIDCFDTWNCELVENNYLHNHARMWYASIWVHTLKLPWQLGADWFLRHLLDGDPASNTLSWRWVTGIQTQGKTYLAKPDNIRKYTNDRFSVTGKLATEAVGIADAPPIKPEPLEAPSPPTGNAKLGRLITDDDLSASEWLAEQYSFKSCASLYPSAEYESYGIAEPVIRFRRKAMAENSAGPILTNVDDVMAWVKAESLDGILTAAPVEGFNRPLLNAIQQELVAKGKCFHTVRHWWDEALFPHATHGFFRFKKAIPNVLGQLKQPQFAALSS